MKEEGAPRLSGFSRPNGLICLFVLSLLSCCLAVLLLLLLFCVSSLDWVGCFLEGFCFLAVSSTLFLAFKFPFLLIRPPAFFSTCPVAERSGKARIFCGWLKAPVPAPIRAEATDRQESKREYSRKRSEFLKRLKKNRQNFDQKQPANCNQSNRFAWEGNWRRDKSRQEQMEERRGGVWW